MPYFHVSCNRPTFPYFLCRSQNINRRIFSILKLRSAVIVVAILVEFIYISKGVLLIYRYSHPSKVCVNHTIQPAEDDDSLEFEKDDRGYNFTVLVYGICSLIRCIEYIPLFIGLWRYLDKTDKKRPHKKLKCKHRSISSPPDVLTCPSKEDASCRPCTPQCGNRTSLYVARGCSEGISSHTLCAHTEQDDTRILPWCGGPSSPMVERQCSQKIDSSSEYSTYPVSQLETPRYFYHCLLWSVL